DDDGGHADAVEVDGSAVGGAAGHAGELQWDAQLGGRVGDEMAQLLVGDHARVVYGQGRAAAQSHARLFLLDAGHVAGDVGFQDDGDVGIDGAGAGGGPAQPDFFHDGLDAVQVVGMGLVPEVAQRFDDQSAAHAVVEQIGRASGR